MMHKEIANLAPQNVWKYFLEITQVPRQSKHEEKILQYLKDFAQKHQLDWEQDKTGNIVIRKPKGKNCKTDEIIVLQSHVDMVCEKNEDVEFNFDTDPIRPYIDGDFVKAEGTTLGADDGIGVAAQLALLTLDDDTLPAMEHLFTVDEETGLTGAFGLDKNLLKGNILLNLDSEDDGQIFIGCAGGIDTKVEIPFEKKEVPANYTACRLKVFGLRGGHSGDDINKGYGNANKLLVRFIWELMKEMDVRLHSFDAGSAHNAIAREGVAIVLFPENEKSKFETLVSNYEKIIKNEFKVTEPNLAVSAEETQTPDFVIDAETQKKVVNTLYAVPHGVMAMSREIDNFVETSTNLAVVKTLDSCFKIIHSHRSSVESAKHDTKNKVTALYELIGAEAKHGDGYPGWAPNANSKIMKVAKETYTDLFNQEPQVLAIHAGLECGLIGEKYPNMDMVSIGPDIKGAHSPDERIEIKTVEKFWKHTLEILRRIR